MKHLKTIYGPVASWRLGSSLGIDLLGSKNKLCSFDCIYCQLGHLGEKTLDRNEYVSSQQLKDELHVCLSEVKPDVITFSGMGEPTLANNLQEAISIIRKQTSIPLGILTNASLMDVKEVRQSLMDLDFVVAKIDAHSEGLFKKINKPIDGVTIKNTINGIKQFNDNFNGKLSIQTMFMNQNLKYAEEISEVIEKIQPNEVQINTPLRPCGIKPLDRNKIDTIESIFKKKGLHTISVYSSKKPKTNPLDKMELFRRRKSIL